MSVTTRIRREGTAEEITFEESEGFEVFTYQIMSLGLEESPLLLDFAGRLVQDNDDMEDIKVTVGVQSVETRTDEQIQEDTSRVALVPVIPSSSDQRQLSSTPAVAADLWCMNNSIANVGEYCSRMFHENDDVLQPVYRIVDTNIHLCSRCQLFFDPSLIVADRSVLLAFTCESDKAMDMGLASAEASECLHRLLQHAIESQHSTINSLQTSTGPHAMSSAERDFERRVASGCHTVNNYEDPIKQAVARSVIDYDKIKAHTLAYLDEQRQLRQAGGDGAVNNTSNVCLPPPYEHNTSCSSSSYEDAIQKDVAFLHGLLRWFKGDFFKWVNKAPCDNPSCQAGTARMESIGGDQPTEQERQQGEAGRVEIYRCNECLHITRFARYNDPAFLVSEPFHRRGRCGEWANAFCLICRALGLDARYVLDFTDHVWVEVWVDSLKRYVHADPCEKRLDAPLLYDAGWGKKLTHVISFSRHGCVDASPRYSRKLKETILRRSSASAMHEKFVSDRDSSVTERFAAALIQRMDAAQEQRYVRQLSMQVSSQLQLPSQGQLPSQVQTQAQSLASSSGEASHRGDPSPSSSDLTLTDLQRRKRWLRRELEGMTLMTTSQSELAGVAGQGRISGDQAWIDSRGEGGEGEKASGEGLEAVGKKGGLSRVMKICVLPTDGAVASSITREQGLAPGPGPGLGLELGPGRGPRGSVNVDVAVGVELVGMNLEDNYDRAKEDQGMGVGGEYVETAVVSAKMLMEEREGEEGAGAGAELGLGLGLGVGSVDMIRARYSLYPVPATTTTAATDSTATANDSVATAVAIDSTGATAAVATTPTTTDALIPLTGHWSCAVPRHILSLSLSPLPASATEGSGGGGPALVSDANETKETFLVRVMQYTIQDEHALGFSMSASGEVAAVFGKEGYPLRAAQGCVTYVKTPPSQISSQISSPPSQISTLPSQIPSVLLQYLPMGGGRHPDTLSFDSTHCLWSLLDHMAEVGSDSNGSTLWDSLRISEVKLWAGTNLVNGVQVSYGLPTQPIVPPGHPETTSTTEKNEENKNSEMNENTPRLEIISPCLSSTHDDPLPHILSLEMSMGKEEGKYMVDDEDEIVEISVRAGNLVDGMTLTTRQGKSLTCGGSGGTNKTIRIPEGYRFIGFYGGTGGHLHNVGIVVLRCPQRPSLRGHEELGLLPSAPVAATEVAALPPPPPTSSSSSSISSPHPLFNPPSRWLQLYTLLTTTNTLSSTPMWSLPLLNHHQHSMEHRRHADVGLLLHYIWTIYRHNPSSVGRTCLETIALYTENIIKNPSDKKLRKIKTTNAYVTSRVLTVSGGVSLLCFGPCAYRLQADVQSFECSVRLFAEGGDLSREEFVGALRSYAGFLRAAIGILYSTSE